MITRRTVTESQAEHVIRNGDFDNDVLSSAPAVAIVLTQSWCPQWTFMSRSLDALGNGPEDLDLALYTYEYDRSPLFREFMSFKEKSWGNYEVPYVRLYKNGELIQESNFLPPGRIIAAFR